MIYRKSRMSPINLKLNHHPPVLLLWHNPKLRKAPALGKLGYLWSSKDQKEAFPFSSLWLTRHVLWFPCARDHETANHTEAIKYTKKKINFPEERRRKDTFNCGPRAESLWRLTISGPDSYNIILTHSQVQATIFKVVWTKTRSDCHIYSREIKTQIQCPPLDYSKNTLKVKSELSLLRPVKIILGQWIKVL